MAELEIKNRNGKKFIVIYDDEDRELIEKYTWHVNQDEKPYARTRIRTLCGKIRYLYMHRLILNAPKDKLIDHKNHNRLDNRKGNIRLCNDTQNAMNTTAWGMSKYLGVTRCINRKKQYKYMYWIANIKINGKVKRLGMFPYTSEGEIQAGKCYDEGAKKYHGEFANLNFKKELCEL